MWSWLVGSCFLEAFNRKKCKHKSPTCCIEPVEARGPQVKVSAKVQMLHCYMIYMPFPKSDPAPAHPWESCCGVWKSWTLLKPARRAHKDLKSVSVSTSNSSKYQAMWYPMSCCLQTAHEVGVVTKFRQHILWIRCSAGKAPTILPTTNTAATKTNNKYS